MRFFSIHSCITTINSQPSATSVLLFIHSFFFRWKSWVIMEWRKTTRNSINEIAVSSHFKSSLQQNEHKSAGNNLSISQNTLQAELVLLLLDAKIFLSYTWISRVWMKDCCSFNENFSLLGKKKMTTKVKKILTIKILPNKVKWNVKDNNKDETRWWLWK